MKARWDEFLGDAPHSGHAAAVYSESAELADTVAGFFASGFTRGEPAVALITPNHLALVAERLAAHGHDAAELEANGSLVTADADATLASIVDSGEPRPDVFETVVCALLDRVDPRFATARTRVFGEMVDVLVRRAQPVAAILLEELWNDFASRRDFVLLCGYALDVFDREAQAGLLPDVCRVHSNVRPAKDGERFAKAVDGALEEVLGPAGAGQLYVVVADRTQRVPAPQLVLMWVSENMPLLAGRILTAARSRYLDMPATPTVDLPERDAASTPDPQWRATLRAATRPKPPVFFSDR